MPLAWNDRLLLLGRVLVAGYFLWSAWFNIRHRRENVAALTQLGIPGARWLVALGTAEMTVASLAFVYRPTALCGGAGLILFTLGADALFHRYWRYDGKERTTHQQLLFEHVALNGGILGLAVASLTPG